MKKTTIITLCMTTLVLVSCGKASKAVDDTKPITKETSIENKAQAAKVCAPFIKYLECSLEKATPARKEVHEKILSETKKQIENDAPDRIAQQCDTYIKILKENPEIAFKNGCNLELDITAPVVAPVEIKK